MTRRMLLAGVVTTAPALAVADYVPTDEQKMNNFARAYNDYVAAVKGGVVDIRLWRRVVREWGRINGKS